MQCIELVSSWSLCSGTFIQISTWSSKIIWLLVSLHQGFDAERRSIVSISLSVDELSWSALHYYCIRVEVESVSSGGAINYLAPDLRNWITGSRDLICVVLKRCENCVSSLLYSLSPFPRFSSHMAEARVSSRPIQSCFQCGWFRTALFRNWRTLCWCK